MHDSCGPMPFVRSEDTWCFPNYQCLAKLVRKRQQKKMKKQTRTSPICLFFPSNEVCPKPPEFIVRFPMQMAIFQHPNFHIPHLIIYLSWHIHICFHHRIFTHIFTYIYIYVYHIYSHIYIYIHHRTGI